MRNRYADIERLKDKFISLDWSVNKWVNDVDISLALSHEDLEPVVRCKDCKHRMTELSDDRKTRCYCPIVDHYTVNDWFCADGERREDGTD